MNKQTKLNETVQGKETPMRDHPLSKEFPEGVPFWMLGMPDKEVREMMALRRNAFPSTKKA
jgi:hypothetical protein